MTSLIIKHPNFSIFRNMHTSPLSLITKGLYRHYKGPIYRVHDIVLHTETKEKLVLYEEIIPSQTNPEHLRFVRPLAMFTEPVQTDNGKIPRFEKIDKS